LLAQKGRGIVQNLLYVHSIFTWTVKWQRAKFQSIDALTHFKTQASQLAVSLILFYSGFFRPVCRGKMGRIHVVTGVQDHDPEDPQPAPSSTLSPPWKQAHLPL
jgi:hypothetical protein